MQIANCQALLRPLSLDALWELKPEVRERMLLLGIRTLGQLAAVPQRLLVEQFGPAGRWYWLLARGIDHRRVAAWQPSLMVAELQHVSDDEPTLPMLEEILDDLAHRVSERLLRAGHSARTVTLIAHLEGSDRRFATHYLKAPAHLRRHLFQTALLLLHRLFADEASRETRRQGDKETGRQGEEVRGLSPCLLVSLSPCLLVSLELRAGGLGTRGVLQLSMFGEADRGPALRAAVARIQDRFGERAVRSAVQLLAELRFQV